MRANIAFLHGMLHIRLIQFLPALEQTKNVNTDESQNKGITKRVGANVTKAPPLVSVVMPAYNTADYIAETLESAFGQTFRDLEVIVVNDGSPDAEQLEKAIAPRLEDIVYLIQPNAGAAIARNTALDNARGEFIAFLDGDDIWFPDFLESQLAFLEANGYDMVYCDAELFGSHLAFGKSFMETAPSNGVADLDSLIDLRCNVLTSSTVARKRVILDVGKFEHERLHGEDFHLWLRISQSGSRIGYQRKQLLKYRVRYDSFSGGWITRAKRPIEVFQRVSRTIKLTDDQRWRVDEKLREFEADLAIAEGKASLLNGNFTDAASAFSQANRYHRSLRLTAVSLMARVAPRMLLKFYRSRRTAELDFFPNK